MGSQCGGWVRTEKPQTYSMVLTFKQFQEKHKKQLAGLTAGQKATRYKAYVNAQARSSGQAVKTKPKGAPKSKAVGKAIGDTIAPFLPGPLKMLAPFAGDVGGFLGEGIGTLLGLGDYKVKKNSIVSEGNSPAYMHSKNGSVFVRHREFITNVYSSAAAGAFSVQNIPIQPGLTNGFPWLSLVTRGFQEWQPHGIVFEFKSNTGMISSAATPSIGMVIMATDYDSFDTNPFSNKVDMENTQYTRSAKATESFYHPVECAYNKNVLDRLFLRDDVVPLGQPPQFYDLGTFAIASVGTPVASQNLGELWVTYDIELMKPTMKNHSGSLQAVDMFWGSATTTNKNLFGLYSAAADNSIGGTISNDGANTATYTFPPLTSHGDYVFLQMQTSAVAASWTTAPTVTTANCDFVFSPWSSSVGNILQPIFSAGDSEVYGAPSASSTELSTSFVLAFRVRITGPGAYFTFDTSPMTWAQNQTSGLLQVFKVNASLVVGANGPLRLPTMPRRTDKASNQRALIAAARGDTASATPQDMIEHLQQQLDALKGSSGETPH